MTAGQYLDRLGFCERELDRARTQRNRAIREAFRVGHVSAVEISETVGLTRQQVYRIIWSADAD